MNWNVSERSIQRLCTVFKVRHLDPQAIRLTWCVAPVSCALPHPPALYRPSRKMDGLFRTRALACCGILIVCRHEITSSISVTGFAAIHCWVVARFRRAAPTREVRRVSNSLDSACTGTLGYFVSTNPAGGGQPVVLGLTNDHVAIVRGAGGGPTPASTARPQVNQPGPGGPTNWGLDRVGAFKIGIRGAAGGHPIA